MDIGCEALAQELKRIRPTIHAFGHCHDCYGIKRSKGLLSINASNVSPKRKPINNVIVVDVMVR